jgi:DNA-binding CsgD family transcriptional regulator
MTMSLEEVVQVSAQLTQRVTDVIANPDVTEVEVGRRSLPYGLTKREFEILGYLIKHHTDREIGDALFISPRTVTTHVGSIINKLGVTSRREAARMAEDHGLV